MDFDTVASLKKESTVLFRRFVDSARRAALRAVSWSDKLVVAATKGSSSSWRRRHGDRSRDLDRDRDGDVPS